MSAAGKSIDDDHNQKQEQTPTPPARELPVTKKLIQASDVKQGQHIIIKGRPCRVMQIRTAKA